LTCDTQHIEGTLLDTFQTLLDKWAHTYVINQMRCTAKVAPSSSDTKRRGSCKALYTHALPLRLKSIARTISTTTQEQAHVCPRCACTCTEFMTTHFKECATIADICAGCWRSVHLHTDTPTMPSRDCKTLPPFAHKPHMQRFGKWHCMCLSHTLKCPRSTTSTSSTTWCRCAS